MFRRLTWSLSGIYIIGLFFTLIKYNQIAAIPTILWMLLGLLMVSRMALIMLEIKSR